jgi:hypothetical protein
VYTIFALYSPSYTLSPHPFPHTGTNLPEKTCSVLLLSDFVKEKNDILFNTDIQEVSL